MPARKKQLKVSEESAWVDDSFKMERTRWGSWVSYNKSNEKLVTSLTEELCLEATRFYLKGKQEGFPDPLTSYDSVVGGKL